MNLFQYKLASGTDGAKNIHQKLENPRTNNVQYTEDKGWVVFGSDTQPTILEFVASLDGVIAGAMLRVPRK